MTWNLKWSKILSLNLYTYHQRQLEWSCIPAFFMIICFYISFMIRQSSIGSTRATLAPSSPLKLTTCFYNKKYFWSSKHPPKDVFNCISFSHQQTPSDYSRICAPCQDKTVLVGSSPINALLLFTNPIFYYSSYQIGREVIWHDLKDQGCIHNFHSPAIKGWPNRKIRTAFLAVLSIHSAISYLSSCSTPEWTASAAWNTYCSTAQPAHLQL